jgi:hypothetical protein
VPDVRVLGHLEAEAADKRMNADNQLSPPITSLDYGYALALLTYMESYDYLVSQPSVMDEATWEKMQELRKRPRRPLPAEPLPIHESWCALFPQKECSCGADPPESR